MKTRQRLKTILPAAAAACLLALCAFGALRVPATQKASADAGAGKLLYYVDAGNMSKTLAPGQKFGVDQIDNTATNNVLKYPSATLAQGMRDMGYSFLTAEDIDSGDSYAEIGQGNLYNSLNDKSFYNIPMKPNTGSPPVLEITDDPNNARTADGADPVTGKEWGFEAYGNNNSWSNWRVLRTVAANAAVSEGYETVRYASEGTNYENLTYRFEVDDGDTPLRVVTGARMPSSFTPSPKSYEFFINGASQGNVNVRNDQNLNYKYENVTGVLDESSGKYFVTLKFGSTAASTQQAHVSRIFIETMDHVTPLYNTATLKAGQLAKQYAPNTLTGTVATTADVTAGTLNAEVSLTLDAASMAAVNAAIPFSEVSVAGASGGVAYSGTVRAIPATLLYFVDCNSKNPADFAAFNAAYGGSLNDYTEAADRAWSNGMWGYTTGNMVQQQSADASCWNTAFNINTNQTAGRNDSTIGYRFTVEPGALYNVYFGTVNPWANTPAARPTKITAGGKSKLYELPANSAQWAPKFFTPLEAVSAEGDTLDVTVEDQVFSGGGAAVLNFLAIARVYDVFNVPSGITFDAPSFHAGMIPSAAFPNGEIPSLYQAGYEFKGWYKDGEFKEQAASSDFDLPVTASTKFYANMEPNRYTVTLDYGEGAQKQGESPVTQIPAVYGAEVSGLPVPVATDDANKLFEGWYTLSSQGLLVSNGDEWAWTTTDTLYARYRNRVDYNIIYVLNDAEGSLADNSVSPTTYKEGLGCALVIPTRAGYSFGNWYTNDNLTDGLTNAIAADSSGAVTLYAKWTALPTSGITYQLDGGTNHVGNALTYTHGVGMTLQGATREHYTFDGWHTAETNGEEVTEITAADTGDKILWAYWIPDTYAVTYVLNGGTNHEDNAAAYTYGAGMALQDPTRTGYAFGGWYGNEALTGDAVTAIGTADSADPFTVYAKWTAKTTRVLLDYAGGAAASGEETDSIDAVYDAAVEGLPNPVRAGYTFGGWHTQSGGAGDEVRNGDTWAEDSAETTLYAAWTPLIYTVTFDSHGGGAVDPQTGIEAGGKIQKPADPTREGYTFGGWYADESLTAAWDFDGAAVNADRALHAKWNPVQPNENKGGCNGCNSTASALTALASLLALAFVAAGRFRKV
jgi:uncharacterized repeat protein (TIGR02543 family)